MTRTPKARVAVGGLPASVARAQLARDSGVADDPSRLDRLLGLEPVDVCSRLLAPARPQKQEALSAIEGAASAQEAIEALVSRGLLEEQWLDERRVIVYATDAGDLGARARDVADLAADAATVSAIESLARECRARGGRVGSDSIRWRVGLAQRAPRAVERRPFDEGRAARFKPGTVAASTELTDLLSIRTDFSANESWDEEIAAGDLFRFAHERWVDAFEEDVRRHWSWGLSRRSPSQNPYAPLCAAWLAGYVIEAIEPELVLFAPARFDLG